MKNIVFVSNVLPIPEKLNGNNENIYNIVKKLREYKNIHITFILFNNQYSYDYASLFSKYVDELIIKKPLPYYLIPLISIFKDSQNYNCPIFFCNFKSAYYFSLFKSTKKILYVADSRTLHYSRKIGLKFSLLYLKYFVEETILFRYFNKIVFVSRRDKDYSRKRTSGKGVDIPIGYDISKLPPTQDKIFDLVFSGDFGYLPNSEAAEYFLQNQITEILNHKPSLKVCFVGRKPSHAMLEYAEKYKYNIIVTGEVDCVEEYLSKSKIYISPLRTGSGMKNKILQAMAASLPIVCTKESISGFSNLDNSSVKVTDDMDEFVEYIYSFLKYNIKELDKMGQTNKQYLINNYSWAKIIDKYYVKGLVN